MNSIEKITEFFKKDALQNVKSIEDILELDVSLLRGIDPINSEKLHEHDINTISDLSQLTKSPKIEDLPELDLPELDVPPGVLQDNVDEVTSTGDEVTNVEVEQPDQQGS